MPKSRRDKEGLSSLTPELSLHRDSEQGKYRGAVNHKPVSCSCFLHKLMLSAAAAMLGASPREEGGALAERTDDSCLPTALCSMRLSCGECLPVTSSITTKVL